MSNPFDNILNKTKKELVKARGLFQEQKINTYGNPARINGTIRVNYVNSTTTMDSTHIRKLVNTALQESGLEHLSDNLTIVIKDSHFELLFDYYSLYSFSSNEIVQFFDKLKTAEDFNIKVTLVKTDLNDESYLITNDKNDPQLIIVEKIDKITINGYKYNSEEIFNYDNQN